jgi:hypothetical protein
MYEFLESIKAEPVKWGELEGIVLSALSLLFIILGVILLISCERSFCQDKGGGSVLDKSFKCLSDLFSEQGANEEGEPLKLESKKETGSETLTLS